MRDDLDLDEASIKPKSGKLAIIVLFAVAVVGVVVAVGLLLRPPSGDPLRIAIAFDGGVNEHYDARLLDSFIEGLDAFGFTGEHIESASAFDDEALRALAAEHDAAHALLFELDVVRQRDSFTSDAGLFRGELAVRLVPLDPQREPHASSMVFAFERNSAVDVANRVAGAWRDGLFPDILGWLYESPGLDDVLKGDVDLGVLEATEALRERENAFRERGRRVSGFVEYCAAEREQLADMRGSDARPVMCAGDPCGQSTVIGVSADGVSAIVQDNSRQFMADVPWTGPSWSEPPETVVELGLGSSSHEIERRPLFSTANILGFANVSRDGRFVSTSGFTAGGSLAVATLEVASSSADSTDGWIDAIVLEGGLRASHTIPSPDGSLTLLRLYDRSSRYNEPRWVAARSLDRLELPFFDGSPALWLSPRDGSHRVAGELYDGSFGVVAFGSLDAEPEITASVRLPGRLTHILGEHEGDILVIWQTGYTCELGVITSEPAPPVDDIPSDQAVADGSGSELANVGAAGGGESPAGDPSVADPSVADPSGAVPEPFIEAPPVAPVGPRVGSRAVLPDCIDAPSLLPDGRLIGVAYTTSEGDAPGDPEVVLVDSARLPFRPAEVEPTFEMVEELPDDALVPLTDGAYIEEAPVVSADGRRVVFNRRLNDWPRDYDLDMYRRVVCWADVPPSSSP